MANEIGFWGRLFGRTAAPVVPAAPAAENVRSGFVQVTDRIRVEAAPRRRRAPATKALLDDKVTARHYKVGGRDLCGKLIEEGKPIDFFDHKCRSRVWVVYLEETLIETHPRSGKPMSLKRFMPKSEHATQAEAMAAAGALAEAIGRGEEPEPGDLRAEPALEPAMRGN